MVKPLAILLGLVVVSGTALILYLGQGTFPPEDIHVVRSGVIRRVARGSGRVEGIEPPPFSFGLPGYLDAVNVMEGHECEPNEVLAELNGEDLKLQIAQAQSKLNELKAKLEVVKIPRSPPAINQLEEKLIEATNDVKSAEFKLKGIQNPPQPRPVSSAVIEDAERNIERAKQNLVLAEAELKRVKVGPSEDQIATEQLKIDAKENELSTAKRILGTTAAGVFRGNLPTLQANVERLQKEVEIARAMYDQVKRGARPEDVDAAQARVKLAQIDIESAQAAKTKLEKPEPPLPATTYEVEQAAMAVETAKSRERQAKAALDDLKRGPEQAEIRAAEATKDQAESALKQLELRREGLKLRAPAFGGLILKRHVEPGSMVAAFTPIITLVDFSQKRVRAEFDVAKLPELKKGMHVTFSSRAFKVDADLDGVIERIVGVGTRKLFSEDPGSSRGGEVAEVLISLPEPKSDLKKQSFDVLLPGLQVETIVTIEQRENVVRVPSTYVSHDRDQAYVWRFDTSLAGTNEAPRRRDVTCGLYDEANIEIVSGLADGDKIMKPKPINNH